MHLVDHYIVVIIILCIRYMHRLSVCESCNHVGDQLVVRGEMHELPSPVVACEGTWWYIPPCCRDL
jgi:hypothetical protein